ncbi:hypothetical protein G7054_g5180 [Neopestalotiopsis clavispora]|nr:hypothetical protein G7054_g5180 [Neopestalotiopsis clavispora]
MNICKIHSRIDNLVFRLHGELHADFHNLRDEVKLALGQIERHLAARQSLRNFDRIAPFLGAAERFSQVVEVVCNGTPYLPWIWAPVKFIIQSARDHAHVLDKLLMAYGNIGTHMPRLSRYAEAFPDDHAFQQMVAYLFEDVLEFHRKAYSMIKKPGWIVFFSSAWGRFEHRFSSLLDSIEQSSKQIDREAVALDIMKTAEQRSKAAVDAAAEEKRWQTQQFQAIMNWLGIEDDIQEAKLDMNANLVPYVYDECLGKAQRPSSDVMKRILPQLVSRFQDIQVIVDGIDEVPQSEHRHLIKNLLLLPTTCTGLRLLLVSQDLPSISAPLSKKPRLCLSEEAEATRKDHAMMVKGSLQELNDDQDGTIPDEVMEKLKNDILNKSEGMFLWVSLVMSLLRMSASMQELQQQISSLPRSLAEVFLFENGPNSFMSIPEAIASVTFACICQLDQALEPTQTSGSTSIPMIDIANGLYGLLPYSNQYWTQHLLEFLTHSEQVETSFSAAVVKSLKQLCQKLMRLSDFYEVYTVADENFQLLHKYLDADETTIITHIINNQEKQPMTQEQTVTSTVDAHSARLQDYHRTVRHVIEQSSIHGVEQYDLIAFKEDYGPSAFVCDWPGCDRMLRGYPSQRQLSSHQARHTQNLRCYDENCSYNDVGFPTETSLKNHKRKMHPGPGMEPIPKRLRKNTIQRGDEHARRSMAVSRIGSPTSREFLREVSPRLLPHNGEWDEGFETSDNYKSEDYQLFPRRGFRPTYSDEFVLPATTDDVKLLDDQMILLPTQAIDLGQGYGDAQQQPQVQNTMSGSNMSINAILTPMDGKLVPGLRAPDVDVNMEEDFDWEEWQQSNRMSEIDQARIVSGMARGESPGGAYPARSAN